MDWKVEGVATAFFADPKLGFWLKPNQQDTLDGHANFVASLYSLLYQRRAGRIEDEDEKRRLSGLLPLRRIIKDAWESGCETLVVEHRYVDLDYRSEFQLFWSRMFEDKPSVISRLHFFGSKIMAKDLHSLDESSDYRGYCVVRPTPLGPVGRTVMKPPANLDKAVLSRVKERPTVFGNELKVEGAPFYQQDGVLMRCAHVVAWTAHYLSRELTALPRVSTGQIAAPFLDSRLRPIPASGLTSEQIQRRLIDVSLPAIVLAFKKLPNKQRFWQRRKAPRIARAICPYLNSGLGVIVLTRDEHAFTIVGWKRLRHGELEFIANDDQQRPYELVSPDEPHCGEWESFLVPVPEKVLLSAEPAENRAVLLMEQLVRDKARFNKPTDVELRRILKKVRTGGEYSVRSRLIEGKRYQAEIANRDLPDRIVRLARLTALPHWVWVVELQRGSTRAQDAPCTYAEVVFDSTSHDDDPGAPLVIWRGGAVATGLYESSKGKEGLERVHLAPWRSIIS